jgi:long-subunit acyl-CoA synthetase (AMP-forming)
MSYQALRPGTGLLSFTFEGPYKVDQEKPLNIDTEDTSRLLDGAQLVGAGAAPIDASAVQQFQDILHPSATCSQLGGMTEIGAAMPHQYTHEVHLGSVGRPPLGDEMRLLDAFGNIFTADDEPGDLQDRHAGMMTGQKNQEVITEGSWYSTGDYIMSPTGGRYHVGRSKELIGASGFQVAAAELEAILLTHPCIVDAAVIGCLRANGVAEVPRAFIIRTSDGGRCSSLTAAEIYAFVAERLPSYKRPNGGIVFVDKIPKTKSGKIERFKLAQMDQFRNSITELMVRNDDTVKVEDVRDIMSRAATGRTSQGLGWQSSHQVAPTVSAPFKPKRQRKMTLLAKMKALRESSSMVTRVTTENRLAELNTASTMPATP